MKRPNIEHMVKLYDGLHPLVPHMPASTSAAEIHAVLQAKKHPNGKTSLNKALDNLPENKPLVKDVLFTKEGKDGGELVKAAEIDFANSYRCSGLALLVAFVREVLFVAHDKKKVKAKDNFVTTLFQIAGQNLYKHLGFGSGNRDLLFLLLTRGDIHRLGFELALGVGWNVKLCKCSCFAANLA